MHTLIENSKKKQERRKQINIVKFIYQLNWG